MASSAQLRTVHVKNIGFINKNIKPVEKPLVLLAKQPKASSSVTAFALGLKIGWPVESAHTQNGAQKINRVFARGHIF